MMSRRDLLAELKLPAVLVDCLLFGRQAGGRQGWMFELRR